MDIGNVIIVGMAPSLAVLAVGICRATWIWLCELMFVSRADSRVRRSRI